MDVWKLAEIAIQEEKEYSKHEIHSLDGEFRFERTIVEYPICHGQASLIWYSNWPDEIQFVDDQAQLVYRTAWPIPLDEQFDPQIT